MKCDYGGTCTYTASKFFVRLHAPIGTRVRCICVAHSKYMLQPPELVEFTSYEAATAALAMQAL